MKKRLVLLWGAIVALLLVACSKPDSNRIRLGLIAEISGDMPTVGASCRQAAEMAVGEINVYVDDVLGHG